MKYLEIKNLRKSFGSLEVIKDISLDVNEDRLLLLSDRRFRQIYLAEMCNHAGDNRFGDLLYLGICCYNQHRRKTV